MIIFTTAFIINGAVIFMEEPLVTISTKQLYQLREELTKRLCSTKNNILRGSLIERYKRCGKVNCHCAQGKGHGPKFFLSVSFPKTKPTMIYIAQDCKEQALTGLSNYQVTKHVLEEISKINQELLRRKEPL